MNQGYTYSNYQNPSVGISPSRFINNQPFYGDNILTLNQGRYATFYLSFSSSNEWRDTIFKGIIEQSTKDYTLIKERNNQNTILIWNRNIDYIIFENNEK